MSSTTTPASGKRELVNEITIDAPVEAVWKAITEADELVRWFPMDCRTTPGPGGTIWFSWRGSTEGEAKIEIWEPNRRLRTSWEAGDPEKTGTPVRLADEYTLTAQGANSTKLRLVSSGFGKHASWDGMYDCIRRGWQFELRGLKHYLERHRAQNRAVAWVQQKVDRPLAKMLDTLMGPEGFKSAPAWTALAEGARWSGTNIDGTPLSGEVLHVDRSGLIVIRLDQWDGALLRIEHESMGGGEHGGLWLWFSIYGEDPKRVAALEKKWSEKCAALFP